MRRRKNRYHLPETFSTASVQSFVSESAPIPPGTLARPRMGNIFDELRRLTPSQLRVLLRLSKLTNDQIEAIQVVADERLSRTKPKRRLLRTQDQ